MNAWFKAGPGSVLAGDDIGFFSPVNDPDYASGLVSCLWGAVRQWVGNPRVCRRNLQARRWLLLAGASHVCKLTPPAGREGGQCGTGGLRARPSA